MTLFCKILTLVCLSSTGLAYWEYQGFSGGDNKIIGRGTDDFLKESYPDYWEGFDKEAYSCLCGPDTQKEREDLIRKTFGDVRFNAMNSSIDKIIKRAITTKNKKQAGKVHFYIFKFKDTRKVEDAYLSMKDRFEKNKDYSIIFNNKNLVLIRKIDHVPQRAFLHFVRGFDHTFSQPKNPIDKEIDKITK